LTWPGTACSPRAAALTLFRRDPLSGQLVLVGVNDNTTNPTQDANGGLPLFYDAALFMGLTAGDYYLTRGPSGVKTASRGCAATCGQGRRVECRSRGAGERADEDQP
jgi:hypothetical protein